MDDDAVFRALAVVPIDGTVRLSITHVMDPEQSKFIEAISGGWPRILSNLKSLLGEIALKTPRASG